jgi:hypothetical protein
MSPVRIFPQISHDNSNMAAAERYCYSPLPSLHHIRLLAIDQDASNEVKATLEVADLDVNP